MCSFLVTTKKEPHNVLHYVNEYQRYRGPDATNIIDYNGVTFLHNLLSITGEFTLQPFIKNNCVAIFNGEIYNYKNISPNAKTDGECIIDAYITYGESFLKQLDGEFSIVLIDYKNNIIIFGVDTFGCKPLNFSVDDGYHFSSYQSALKRLNCKNITQVNGNEWFIYNIIQKKLSKFSLIKFDTDNEYKTNFDDWNLAFNESIYKRATTTKPVMMGLSEGYDSGTICSALIKQNIKFKAYSVNVLDPPSNVLLWRHGKSDKPLPIVEGVQLKVPDIQDKKLYFPSLTEHISVCNSIYNKCEDYEYVWMNNHTEKLQKTISRNTYGFIGAGFFLPEARKDGYRVCLSGCAGDILGCKDINKKMRELDNLNYLVDYYDNNVYSCEYCCGVHGIEIRYPYLDVKLWQETFWLDKTIHKHWKSPQRQYMIKNQFPFVDIDKDNKEIFEYVGFHKPMSAIFTQYRESLQ